MKNNFTLSLVKYLIEKEYYNYIDPEQGIHGFLSQPVSLIKEFQGTSILLEIIDGDELSAQDISHSMLSGANIVNNITGFDASIYKLFIFDAEPEAAKLEAIEQGQVDLDVSRRFLKGFTINLSKKEIKRYYTFPTFDGNLIRAVNKFFAKGLDSAKTTPEDIFHIIEQRKRELEIEFKADKSWVTYLLVATNILVFLLLMYLSKISGTSYDSLLSTFGAKDNSLILQGEWWRFISPIFLHGDIVHLGFNCYSLFIIGPQVERLFGHVKFLIIYFVAGISGFIASFAFSIIPSVGASGAIFGLLGAMLLFGVKRPSLLKGKYGANLITVLVINLAYGFMNKRIDNFGHIGGLVGGFFITSSVYVPKEKSQKSLLIKLISLVVVIALALVISIYGFNNKDNRLLQSTDQLKTLDSQKIWAEAEKLGEDILSQNPDSDNIRLEVLWSLTKSELNQKKFDEAIEHAKLLLDVSPDNGHYMLGIIYFYDKQYENAKEELERAKMLGSPNTEAIDSILSQIESK